MSKYIEREAFLKKLSSEKVKAIVGVVGVVWVQSLFDKIPTADVVEVVRCKDCKNCDLSKNIPYCLHHSEGVLIDDYCSYGERKCDE